MAFPIPALVLGDRVKGRGYSPLPSALSPYTSKFRPNFDGEVE
jgi:hypothetical protein